MRVLSKRLLGLSALGLGAFLSSSASASLIQFATFDVTNANYPFTWTNLGPNAGSMSASAAVQFTLTEPTLLTPVTYNNATLTITSAPTPTAAAFSVGSLDIQPLNDAITISVVNNAAPVGFNNLLTATVINADLYGVDGSTNGTTAGQDGMSGQIVAFTSDYVNLGGNGSFILGLNTLTAPVGIGPDGILNSFAANIDGQFSAASASANPNNPYVPEPASLGLLGLSAMGLLARRRRA